MNNILSQLLGVLLLVCSTASMAQVIVEPDDPQGWFAGDQAGGGAGTVSLTETRGAGPGALEFTTTGNTADQISAVRIPLIRLNDITTVGYDFYSNHPAFAPAIKIEYFGTNSGTLVYEPGENGAYSTDTWISRPDVSGGNWWTTADPAGPRQSLAAWQAQLGNPLVNFFKVGVGSGWNAATIGHADLVVLNGTTWDFSARPAGPLPPPPASASPVPVLPLSGLALMILTILAVAGRRFARR